MTAAGIREEYFRWMALLVFNPKYMHRGRSWNRLFRLLDEQPFRYIHERDANRAADGVCLRNRFGTEIGYFGPIDPERPCSVLEMMVALAKRCEESMLSNDEYGDRTGVWFFEMIENLGLADQDDARFDRGTCCDILDSWMDGKYLRNGEGSLFRTEDPRKDMRQLEIWYQMQGWLIEKKRGIL